MSDPKNSSATSAYFSNDLDPRLTPARDDLAASWLRDQVKAPKYVDPKRSTISVPVASVYRSPDKNQAIETEFLFGEAIDVYDHDSKWAWVQSVTDGYVGYIPTDHLTATDHAPTHRVTNIGTFVYPSATYKMTPQRSLSYGSAVSVASEKDGMSLLATGGYVPTAHLAPLEFHGDEIVAEAFRFLGIPYLWGGRSHVGLDCSALIQLVLQACNYKAPRDSDLQEKHLGRPIDREDVQGGDLVFFRGHVGLMVDDSTLIHANDRAMAVSIDDLDEYIRWRTKNGKTPVKMFKRL
jgi:cell wall-associated NlpC family hydrolase